MPIRDRNELLKIVRPKVGLRQNVTLNEWSTAPDPVLRDNQLFPTADTESPVATSGRHDSDGRGQYYYFEVDGVGVKAYFDAT